MTTQKTLSAEKEKERNKMWTDREQLLNKRES